MNYIRTYTHTELVILFTARTDGAPDVRCPLGQRGMYRANMYVHTLVVLPPQTDPHHVCGGGACEVCGGGSCEVRGGGWGM